MMSQPTESSDAAADRPRRRRTAARVVIVSQGKVLLLSDCDPHIPGLRWWQTPGGGIDDGEDVCQAAAREVREETGHDVDPSQLIGPVMVRRVIHGYSDRILEQHETFFVLTVPEPFTVSLAGLTPRERTRRIRADWLHIDSLDTLDQQVWPKRLPEIVALAGNPQAWPADFGVIEESTLPVG